MSPSPRVVVAVLGGGSGERFGASVPKAFAELLGRPLILHSLIAFDAMAEVVSIRAAIPPAFGGQLESAAAAAGLRSFKGFVPGGMERPNSALAVLRALEADQPDVVLIHDAARPLVDPSEVRSLLAALGGHGGALLAAPPVDTLWRVLGRDVEETVNRHSLVRALTPQAFPYRVIRDAYESGILDGYKGTDDASFAWQYGASVVWVPGSSRNIKVTHPEDLALAETLLRQREGCGAPDPGSPQGG